jgi:arylsulfatase
LALAGAALAIGAAWLWSQKQSAPIRKPNVLLIIIDALRADSLSCYDYYRETSPHIDRLARDSAIFLEAVSAGGNTPTVMSAIMTGRYPFFRDGETWSRRTEFGLHRFYRDGEKVGLPRSLETLAEVFSRHGYNTAGVVTNPYLKREFNMDQGFDEYIEIFPGEDTDRVYSNGEEVTAAARTWLDRASDPFFLYLHYMDVHGPYLPPERFKRRFEYPRVPDQDESELFAQWVAPNSTTGPDAELVKQHQKGNYDAEIAYVDTLIGNVLQALEDRGLDEDTIVVITSDHGDEFLEHGGTTHVGTLYEEIVHVPLIIHLPGQQGRVIDSLVRNFDLGPTVLDYSGIETSSRGVDARSLRPLIEGATESSVPSAFANFPYEDPTGRPGALRMLRTQRYKLLFQTAQPELSELYDLARDPGEKKNLFQAHQGVYARMLWELSKIVSKLEEEATVSDADPGTGPVTSGDPSGIEPETEKQLRALGYIQ